MRMSLEECKAIDEMTNDFCRNYTNGFWDEFVGDALTEETKHCIDHKLDSSMAAYLEQRRFTGAKVPDLQGIKQEFQIGLVDKLTEDFNIRTSLNNYLKIFPRALYEKMRHIKSNILIKVNSRSDPIQVNASSQELKAQNTLRDMLTEKEWRKYAINGFIMVKGSVSGGLWYQIFQRQRSIKVYKSGKLINTICIHTDKKLPPTDHVINMKILIEIDEKLIWDNGNVSSANGGLL